MQDNQSQKGDSAGREAGGERGDVKNSGSRARLFQGCSSFVSRTIHRHCIDAPRNCDSVSEAPAILVGPPALEIDPA